MPRTGPKTTLPAAILRSAVLIMGVGLLLVAGCGDDRTGTADRRQQPDDAIERRDSAPAGRDREGRERPAGEGGGGGGTRERTGTRVTIGASEFGEMLFDSRRRAIYVFESDRKDESVCYDACAEAWPPVLSKAGPVAGKGVDPRRLGTLERRDGTRQVTYAGRPLYYYAHEGPGEVRCHNVHLNGGLWWVVGPDGRPRA